MTKSPVLDLTCELMSRVSVTPEDAGCQALMAHRLEALGFRIEWLCFEDVVNFWAVRGDSGPIMAFAGHTDVVPAGLESAWLSPPFEPQVREGILYGRGAADMKGSLAAMLVATERFCAEHADHTGRIAFLITSDEEGPAVNGTRKVIEHLTERGEKITWCVVGEPSSSSELGDVIKNGRRGSLGGDLTIKGIQGHIAYPEKARNPIHQCTAPLQALVDEVWDEGNDFFPATSFQISNINGGTGVTNVIPAEVKVVFNFRYSTEVTCAELKQRTEQILDRTGIDYDLDWTLFGEPFLTPPGTLVAACQAAVRSVTGITPVLATSGGTSDGRFIAPSGAEVIELGPCNATIHQVNECVEVAALDQLAQIYQHVMTNLLVDNA